MLPSGWWEQLNPRHHFPPTSIMAKLSNHFIFIILIYRRFLQLILNPPVFRETEAKMGSFPDSCTLSPPIGLWCKMQCIVGGDNQILVLTLLRAQSPRSVIGKFILIKWQLHHGDDAAAPALQSPGGAGKHMQTVWGRKTQRKSK